MLIGRDFHLAFSFCALPKPYASAAAVLGNELDAGRFKGASDGGEAVLVKPDAGPSLPSIRRCAGADIPKAFRSMASTKNAPELKRPDMNEFGLARTFIFWHGWFGAV